MQIRNPEVLSRSRVLLLLLIVGLLIIPSHDWAQSQTPSKQKKIYYPLAGDGWQRQRPEEVGMDGALLAQAISYAKTQASTIPALELVPGHPVPIGAVQRYQPAALAQFDRNENRATMAGGGRA